MVIPVIAAAAAGGGATAAGGAAAGGTLLSTVSTKAAMSLGQKAGQKFMVDAVGSSGIMEKFGVKALSSGAAKMKVFNHLVGEGKETRSFMEFAQDAHVSDGPGQEEAPNRTFDAQSEMDPNISMSLGMNRPGFG